MANSLFRYAFSAVIFAFVYQLLLADLIALFKPWRKIQPLSDFPGYSCQRMTHPAFEGCEDMWLDDEARLLYAACTGTRARIHWAPTVGFWNASTRPTGGSWISVLSIDQPKEAGLIPFQKAKFHGYKNAVKGGPDLLGFDVEILPNGKRRFWLINQRPPVDATGEIIDTGVHIYDPTIDVFEAEKGSTDLHFVKTVSNEHVFSPNKPAAVGDGSMLVTNDGSVKSGFRRNFDIALGGGSIAYCSETNDCHIAASSGFKLPNGMVRGKDGYFWIPNCLKPEIVAMYLDPETKKLHHVTSVTCDGVSIDNLSVDKNGHILAAGFPAPVQFLKHSQDPFNVDAPATIFQIVKVDEPNKYKCEKVLEDRDGAALSGISVAARDVKTGRIFTGGVLRPLEGKQMLIQAL